MNGSANFRTFLNLAKVPSCQGRRLRGIAWVHGELSRERRPPELFRAIVEKCRLHPFLFVSDGTQVLLGAISQSPAPDATILRGRAPVLETLQGHLANIEIVREPVETLCVELDHRYDRLFPS